MTTKLKKSFSLRKFFQETDISIEEQLIKDELALVSNSKNLKFYHGTLSKQNAEKQLQYYFEKKKGDFFYKLYSYNLKNI